MTKQRKQAPPHAATRAQPAKGMPAGRAAAANGKPSREGGREYVESLVIAFLLAFLFRSFEAEGYQIPTGSMGPTLMGRHKDLQCSQCGYRYRVGSSSEIDQLTNEFLPGGQVVAATCPVCRYSMPVGPFDPLHDTPSYSGDRIAVNKVSYSLGAPDRWDVAVFKCPEQAHDNYIKRIVGLPREEVRIFQGDIYTRQDDAEAFEIQRKPPDKVNALRQIVYDNDYLVEPLLELGWPARWQVDPQAATPPGGWKILDAGRAFEFAGAGSGTIRYHHLVPGFEDWRQFERLVQQLPSARWPEERLPRPQLVSDFYGYNSGRELKDLAAGRAAAPPLPQHMGLHWVGDLMLECEVDVRSDRGRLVLELGEGSERFTARFDLADGSVVLGIAGVDSFAPRAQTAMRGKGTHTVAFANVDDQLLVWVDNGLVSFDAPTGYSDLDTNLPTAADFTPAAISAADVELSVRHLRLWRDIYYIANRNYEAAQGGALTDYLRNQYLFPPAGRQPPGSPPGLSHRSLTEFLSDPARWAPFKERRHVDFRLGEGQYLALGDNSPNSLDARFWRFGMYWVADELLIGKAMFVYWPHAIETPWNFRIPGTEIRVPCYPNLSRMRRIN